MVAPLRTARPLWNIFLGRYVLSVIGSLACESGVTGAGWGRQMLERITNLKRLKPPVWSTAFVIALSLIAIALPLACGDETKPASTPNPASTLTPASGNTSTPAIGPTPTSTPTIVPAVSTASDELRSIKERAAPTATPTIVAAVPTASDELRSTKERAAPAATAAELTELVDGNSAFAFDLYRYLGAENGNLFYSPYSISLALAMTYAGARGETDRQMADTVHFLLPQDRLHPAFNALDIDLASRGGGAVGKGDEGFTLNIANAVWGQKDYEFLAPFLDVLAENYGAGVRPVDFKDMDAREESRLTINDWIADQTEDRIKDLIPKNAIKEITVLVLTNAIYFKAAWNYPFKTSMGVRPFHLLDSSEVDVPMMRQTERLGYVKGDGYQLLDLPYDGLEISMTILLPDAGTFKGFEQAMDAALFSRTLESIERDYIELTMPKFEFESEFSLSDPLKAMGMPNAFDRSASEFSGMDGRSCLAGDLPCLVISNVVHKAFVSVDEEGTEAAAATGVITEKVVSGRPDPIRIMVDRPFIFIIRDRATDAILFVGRVEDPGK